eukprot:6405702-Amphidinium_carterae.1
MALQNLWLRLLKELQGAQQAHRPQDMLKVFLLYHKEVAISDANHLEVHTCMLPGYTPRRSRFPVQKVEQLKRCDHEWEIP